MIDDPGEVMTRINQVWLDGNIANLEPLMHPDIVMAFPGLKGSVRGRDGLIAGFHDFRNSAVIGEFRYDDLQVDVAGNTAVVTFRYEMLYQRSGGRFRATGRDLWVFQRQNDAWLAVWRAMLDVDEKPA